MLSVLALHHMDITANTAHADLCSILVDIWTSSTMKPLPIHILGHQDTAGKQVNRLEQLNVMMDALAKWMATAIHNEGLPLIIPSISIPLLQYQSTYISGTLYKTLYFQIMANNLDHYYLHSLLGAGVDRGCISYLSLEAAQSSVPRYLIIFISKWLSNTLPTGVVIIATEFILWCTVETSTQNTHRKKSGK